MNTRQRVEEDSVALADETPRWADVLGVLRARSSGVTVIALVCLCVATSIWGRSEVELPTMASGMAETLPLAVLIPLPYACVVSLALRSAMADFDLVAARSMRLIDFAFLSWTLIAAISLLSLGVTLADATVLLPLVLRNTLWWTGIACVSVWLFGRSLGWVLPVTLLVPLYESARGGDESAVSWGVPRLPVDSLWSWTATGLAVIAGTVLVLYCEGWPRRQFARLRRRPTG
ncbi:hypothetical protein [Streptosporangium sp. KLBMP 9127]|nr:hypothetical protein [Streptosporangium sp. KLBMP 9127]